SRRRLEERLEGLRAAALQPAAADVRDQLRRLLGPGFVTAAGTARLDDIRRYLAAADHRLDKLGASPVRDGERMAVVHGLERDYERLVAGLPDWRVTHEVLEIRWLIEELRVSLFAQQLGTPKPVSEARIRRAMAEAAAAS
ncbi:MAG TPA: DUF3418 domain-containing protein, partial [Acidimicrobiales bacterium]|nr:DUF3418 domain-containing protein [Acidimicrobiales bacterium]